MPAHIGQSVKNRSGYGPVMDQNKRIELIFIRNAVITRKHILTNSNLKVYKFLAKADPETCLNDPHFSVSVRKGTTVLTEN